MPGVSLRPSTFVEGGAVPVDRNLTWKECRFNLFDYQGKSEGRQTTALRVTYVDDDGQEYVQQYSVGDPERFSPSEDGKHLVAVGSAIALSKSSNFSLLLDNLVSAGFPENRLPSGDDKDLVGVAVLDGLYTHNIGLPEPKRAGLTRTVVAGAPVREKVISVPDHVLRLPWEKKGASAKAAVASPPGTTAGGGDDKDESSIEDKAIAFVAAHVGEDGITRRQLATLVLREMGKDLDRDAVSSLIFNTEFGAALLANGYKLSGEKITKA